VLTSNEKGALHLPQGGSVRVVQGTVRALFYTKFTRKKGTLLSLRSYRGVNPPLLLNDHIIVSVYWI
jgi:hypothetical protein